MGRFDLPDDVIPMASAVVRVSTRRDGMAGWAEREESVPEEVPVALVYNGVSHAVMLASPADLEDFGLGFSLSEGILHHRAELYDMELIATDTGLSLQMTVAAERFAALRARRRTLAGRSGCGLCGAESLEQVIRPLPSLPPGLTVDRGVLGLAPDRLQAVQPLHLATGGVHAAAWFDAGGELLCVREDIGRHNALDKLIGALARADMGFSAGFAVVTSRASFEMVQKGAAVGIPLLAAMSAPTGLAVRIADKAGLTLAAFLRPGRFTLYSHPWRIGE